MMAQFELESKVDLGSQPIATVVEPRHCSFIGSPIEELASAEVVEQLVAVDFRSSSGWS